MTYEDLVDALQDVFDLDDIARHKTVGRMQDRAKALGKLALFKDAYKDAKRRAEDYIARVEADIAQENHSTIFLERDRNGQPYKTIENYTAILRGDERFDTLVLNELTRRPEVTENLKTRAWTDADDSVALGHIESTYRLYDESKYRHAMNALLMQRAYNPIKTIVDMLEWDGQPRIEEFLVKWGKAQDNRAVREASRLIFAGGIHRLYNPGCKFDDVVILVGAQGGGKSTLVRWLNIRDEFFAEVNEIDGQKGIESLAGAWICELSELLALRRAKEVEAVKGYITRQRDKYRMPYARLVTDNPRRNIFIGTTNNVQFLTDKTGNRRFYPVEVECTGTWLYDNKEECQEYIKQCWAEARELYYDGKLQNYANYDIIDDLRDMQMAAVESDWREGAIEAYLETKPVGTKVCVMTLWEHALDMPEGQKPKRNESGEIGLIMRGMDGWVRYRANAQHRYRFDGYGVQVAWEKVSNCFTHVNEDELPF